MQSRPFVLRLLTLIALCSSLGPFARSVQAAVQAAGQPRPAELKKLHILVILDTQSNLADGLRIDEKRLDALLFDTIPLERRGKLDFFTGKDVTREKILSWVKSLRVTPDEGILVFYGGHGATDKDKGHYLQLKNGPPLLRSELRKALEAGKPGLALLLTDCCSTHVKLPPGSGVKIKGEGLEVTKTIPPTVSCLFFRARGTVDITAATDSAAWGDIEQGGLFTRTLCHLLRKPVKEFDRTGQGFVTWEQFFPRLKNSTQLAFTDWSKQMRARGETIGDSVQIPRYYSLGQPLASSVVEVADKDAKSYAVVSLENKTDQRLLFRTRWSPENESAWQRGELKPGGRTVIYTPVEGPLGDAFELLIEFEGRKGTGRLTPRVWKGKGKPTFADGEPATIGSNK
jgi:hypothetical protein